MILLLKRWGKHSFLLLMVVFFMFVLLLTSIQGNAGRDDTPIVHKEWILPSIKHTQGRVSTEVVRNGDTAGLVLARLGLPTSEVGNIIHAAASVYT